MRREKILVTGANGQLGQEIQQLAASYPQYDFVCLSREQLPIHHTEGVRSFFRANQPDFCINCAAYTAVDKAESERDIAFGVNAKATETLATVCREQDCVFIHISTDYVFDGTASTPYKTDSPTNPQNVYGASKLEGERLALQANPASIIIRTSWVYSEFGKNFVKTMMKLMGERPEINVVNDQFGSPTYAADLAKAILQIIKHLTPHSPLPTLHSPLSTSGIYHFSNEGVINWFEFAVAIRDLSGKTCKVNPIPTSQYPTPAKRPAWSVLDKTRIQEIFGIQLRDWKQSLADCIERINKTTK